MAVDGRTKAGRLAKAQAQAARAEAARAHAQAARAQAGAPRAKAWQHRCIRSRSRHVAIAMYQLQQSHSVEADARAAVARRTIAGEK